MVFSRVVQSILKVLGAFEQFSAANKARVAELKGEITTYCLVLYKAGHIKISFDADLLIPENGKDKKTGIDGRTVKYTGYVSWVKDPRRTKDSHNIIPKPVYMTLFKVERVFHTRRFWEVYQEEPRFDIQVELLEQMLCKVEDAMRRRFGVNFRSKLIRKAGGEDLALDEKAAYATLHTLPNMEVPLPVPHFPPGMYANGSGGPFAQQGGGGGGGGGAGGPAKFIYFSNRDANGRFVFSPQGRQDSAVRGGRLLEHGTASTEKTDENENENEEEDTNAGRNDYPSGAEIGPGYGEPVRERDGEDPPGAEPPSIYHPAYRQAPPLPNGASNSTYSDDADTTSTAAPAKGVAEPDRHPCAPSSSERTGRHPVRRRHAASRTKPLPRQHPEQPQLVQPLLVPWNELGNRGGSQGNIDAHVDQNPESSKNGKTHGNVNRHVRDPNTRKNLS